MKWWYWWWQSSDTESGCFIFSARFYLCDTSPSDLTTSFWILKMNTEKFSTFILEGPIRFLNFWGQFGCHALDLGQGLLQAIVASWLPRRRQNRRQTTHIRFAETTQFYDLILFSSRRLPRTRSQCVTAPWFRCACSQMPNECIPDLSWFITL